MSSEPLVGRFTIGTLITEGAITAHKDGNYGSLYPRIEDFTDNGLPLLTAKVLVGGRIDFAAAQKLNVQKANTLKYGFIETNDVLLAHNATVGRVAIVPELKERALVGTSLTYFRLDKSKLLPRYLAAFFESNDFQNQLSGIMGLSTRNQVPITAQRLLEIEVPPLETQLAISNMVGALDDRITLLRETNKTLEAIAQAIFKSWFVDFDPVRAKMEGRQPEGMDEETAALFPDSFEELEQRLVPTGWSMSSFGQCLDHTIGGDWGTEEATDINKIRVAIIRGTDIPDLQAHNTSRVPIRFTSAKKLKSRQLQSGDIVIEVSGGSKDQPTGRSLLITDEILEKFDCPVEPASFCRLFRPKNKYISHILNQKMQYLYTEGKTWEYQNQSTGIANFQTTFFLENEQVVVPTDDIYKCFLGLVAPLVSKSNSPLITSLVRLRDTLLPRLISGQLRLPEAQEQVEDALS